MLSPYQSLVARVKKIALLQGVEYLLGWDQETYMPKKSSEVRGDAIELLAGIAHNEKISPEFEGALRAVVNLETGECLDSSLGDNEQANVREIRRDYLKQVKLPQDFVEEFASVTASAHHAWLDARSNNRFAIFQPHFEKIVELNRKKADYLGYRDHPYDALMDCFEPGVTVKELIPLFERLKIALIALLKQIQARPDPITSFSDLDYDHNKQLAIGKKIFLKMGLSEEGMRLDESVHPMCVPIHAPYDIRATTRIDPKDVCSNILSCLHEGGHALYHSNLPEKYWGTPLCEAVSYGIDESQSRTWEVLIGRSLPFWKFFFPMLQKVFPEQLDGISLQSFYRTLNVVEPSLIRVHSDEVGYNLHILLRFEIEKALIEGKVQPRQIPEIWSEKMLAYLSIVPKADSEGCLQDIHWSTGAIGYFPTYTLGNLYAAQFFETFAQEHPGWADHVEKGDFSGITSWQKEKIHQHGRRYLPNELCTQITGRMLSEEPFIRYLTGKYTEIYGL